MSSDIFLFLSDEAFASLNTGAVVRYAEVAQNGMGMIDDNLLNYFIDHSLFLDPMSNGMNPVRVRRCNTDQQTGLAPTGRMMLHFDAAKLLDDTSDAYSADLVNAFVVHTGDGADVIRSKQINLGALFNIVDTIFHSRQTSGRPNTVDEIDAIMTSALAPSSTYRNYVPGSLQLTSTTSAAAARLSNGTVSTMREYWDGCSFSFKYPLADNNSGVINFHIWLNAEQFKANYPFSTIVDCIYPFKPEWILNPTTALSQIRAILASSDYKNKMLDEAVTKRDHSGASILSSTYMVESGDTKIGFLLMYKGAAPDSTTMRIYVRNKLLAEVDSAGNPLGSETEWKNRLPDLFVDGEYYLVPMYHQRIEYPGNVHIERSFLNLQSIYSKVRAVISDYIIDDLTLIENLEIVQAPGHDLYIACIPANPGTQPPASELHPTYEATDAVSANWNRMTLNDRKFAEQLAKCLTVCLGLDAGVYTFSDDVIGNLPAKAFICGNVQQNTNMVYKMLVYDAESPIWG